MKTLAKLLIILILGRCTVSESLTTPNADDRRIVGYSKNMKYYKVVDGYGNPAPQVRILEDTLKPGDILICEYTLQN